jgi:hypothetical protein
MQHLPRRRASASPALELSVLALLPWAYGIAQGVCRDVYRKGGHDPRFLPDREAQEDLESVAAVALVELLHRFDELRLSAGNPAKMFQDVFETEIRSRCRRAAQMIRNGGTDGAGSSKAARAVRVRGLPESADGDVPLPWPQRDDEVEEPVKCQHEPVVAILRNRGREK